MVIEWRVSNDGPLWPVASFFSVIPDSSFVRILRNLANYNDFVYNNTGYNLPGNEEPCDPKLDGIEFFVHNTGETIVSGPDLIKIVREAIDSHVKIWPAEKDELEEIFEIISERYKDK